MKRFSSVILVLMILFTFGSASAGESYSDPILFRGAEWGSTYADVQIVLPDGVSMRDLKTTEYWFPISEFMYDESGWGSQVKAEIGCYTYANSSSLKNVKVAGYDVEGLYLYFYYTPDESGNLVKDAKHTAFMYGYYKLEPKAPDAVYEDLVRKLSSLYGDVDEEISENFIIDKKMSLWNGADGTMVSIYKEDYSSGSHYIYIKYGFQGADNLRDAAYAAEVKAENESAASNTEGL